MIEQKTWIGECDDSNYQLEVKKYKSNTTVVKFTSDYDTVSYSKSHDFTLSQLDEFITKLQEARKSLANKIVVPTDSKVDFKEIKEMMLVEAYKDNSDCAFNDTHVVEVITENDRFRVVVLGADDPVVYAPDMADNQKHDLLKHLWDFLIENIEDNSGAGFIPQSITSHYWGETTEY